MRVAAAICLTEDQVQTLQQWSRGRSLPARVVERARVVLLAAEGLENKEIARRMNMTPEKAARWRNRFLTGGIAALEKDAPRPGRTRRTQAGSMAASPPTAPSAISNPPSPTLR